MSQRTKNGNPYLGWQFFVEVDGLQVATFAECSGLQVETETFEYAEGGLNLYTHKLPVRTKYSNITLKRGIDPGADLYEWFASTVGGNDLRRKNVTITLYAPQGSAPRQQVRAWKLMGALPIKWTGPDLKADAGAVAIETLEFVHHGVIDVER